LLLTSETSPPAPSQTSQHDQQRRLLDSLYAHAQQQVQLARNLKCMWEEAEEQLQTAVDSGVLARTQSMRYEKGVGDSAGGAVGAGGQYSNAGLMRSASALGLMRSTGAFVGRNNGNITLNGTLADNNVAKVTLSPAEDVSRYPSVLLVSLS
jgi:hypothetical protein